MKLAFVISFIALLCTAHADDRFHPQFPTPTYNALLSVQYLDDAHLVAVGDNGTVLRSNDSGATWTGRQETLAPLLSVAFMNDHRGIAVGDSGTILLTTDGGAHWMSRWSPSDQCLRGVAFADSKTGIISGPDGLILRSVDSGETWKQVDSKTRRSMFGITFVNPTTGFVAAAGGVNRTTDGGATWFGIYTPGFSYDTTFDRDTLFTVAFFDASTGIVGGQYARFGRTTDGGATWIKNDSVFMYDRYLPNTHDVWAIAKVNSTTAIVGGDVAMRLTTDRGATFRKFESGWIRAYAVRNSSHAVAVGTYGGIVRSTDMTTWHAVLNSKNGYPVNAIAFADARHGLAVGGSYYSADTTHWGGLSYTVDGGKTWTESDSGKYFGMIAVSMPDTSNAFAISTSGTFVATTDGGASWNTRPFIAKYSPQSIAFVNASTGYVLADTILNSDSHIRKLFKTTNGGADWNPPIVQSGNSIVCIDADTLFLTTSSRPFRSTNGGATWATLADTVRYFCFVNARLGYGIGRNGELKRTTNGGATWNTLAWKFGWDQGYSGYQTNIAFADSLHGIVSSYDNSNVLRTSDGGTTWLVHVLGRDWYTGYLPSYIHSLFLAYPQKDSAIVASNYVLLSTNAATAPAHFYDIPSLMDFENVRLGTTAYDSVLVLNTGTAALTIRHAFVDDGVFEVLPRSRVIHPGETALFYVAFTPRDIVQRNVHLIFFDDGSPYPDSVSLLGRGVGGPVFAIHQQRYPGSLPTLDMGEVFVEHSKRDSIIVHNDGDKDLHVTDIVLDSWWRVDTMFRFEKRAAVISPGDSAAFPVVLYWMNPNYAQDFAIFSHDGVTSPDTCWISGGAYFSFLPRPSVIDFGDVTIGTSKTDSFYVHNGYSHDSVYFNYINSSDYHFSFSQDSTLILPGDSLRIVVTYSPDSGGMNHLSILDTVQITGRGVGPWLAIATWQGSYFNNVRAGDTATLQITFFNPGDRPTQIDSIVAKNTDAEPDSLFDMIPQSLTIAPHDSMHATMRYHPVEYADYHDGLFWVYSNTTKGIDNFFVEGSMITGVAGDKAVPASDGIIFCYPNPTSSGIIISHSLPSTNHNVLRIYDVMGRCVLGPIAFDRGSKNSSMTISDLLLPDGVYLCEVRGGGLRASGVVVVRK